LGISGNLISEDAKLEGSDSGTDKNLKERRMERSVSCGRRRETCWFQRTKSPGQGLRWIRVFLCRVAAAAQTDINDIDPSTIYGYPTIRDKLEEGNALREITAMATLL
jgi:hypothetical protein